MPDSGALGGRVGYHIGFVEWELNPVPSTAQVSGRCCGAAIPLSCACCPKGECDGPRFAGSGADESGKNGRVWPCHGARVIICVGGTDVRAEARALHVGARIVVGTPVHLRDYLERKQLDLSQRKTIVLDEADEMLDLAFREDLEVTLEATPSSQQTLLFSASMPREIKTLARRYPSETVRIETLWRDQQRADIEYQAMRVGPGDVENGVVNLLCFYEVRSALEFFGMYREQSDNSSPLNWWLM